jgi:hypothetical protein
LEKAQMLMEFDKSLKDHSNEERLYEMSNAINNLTNELRERESTINELKMRMLDSQKGSFIVKSKRPDDLKSYLDISDDQGTTSESCIKKVIILFIVV